MPDGTTLFQEECPANAKKSEKIDVPEVSNLGFYSEDAIALKAGDRLLNNGDFEQDLENWQVTGDSQTLEREGMAGTAALRLFADGTAQSEAKLGQCISAKGVGEVSLGAAIRRGGSADSHIDELRLISFATDDCTLRGEYNAQLNPSVTPGWQILEKTNLKPSLGAHSLLVEIVHINKGTEASDVLWDNVELTLTQPDTSSPSNADAGAQYTLPLGQNYLINGNFEATLENWNSDWPSQWMQYGGQNVSGGIIVKASSNFDEIVRKEAISQCVNLGTHKNFKVGISYKLDKLSSQSGMGSLRVAWMQDLDCSGRQQFAGSFETSDSDGWQIIGGTLSAPEGARSALVRVDQTVDGAGLYSLFWDDAFFTAIP
jgi:hypothetical protein